jgi:hypothetical protein
MKGWGEALRDKGRVKSEGVRTNKPKKMGGENEFSSHFRIYSVSAANNTGAESD